MLSLRVEFSKEDVRELPRLLTPSHTFSHRLPCVAQVRELLPELDELEEAIA